MRKRKHLILGLQHYRAKTLSILRRFGLSPGRIAFIMARI